VVRRREDDEKKKKRTTGCGATNACVSLKKESGVIRSDIFSRSLPVTTSSPSASLSYAKIWPSFFERIPLLQKAPSFFPCKMTQRREKFSHHAKTITTFRSYSLSRIALDALDCLFTRENVSSLRFLPRSSFPLNTFTCIRRKEYRYSRLVC